MQLYTHSFCNSLGKSLLAPTYIMQKKDVRITFNDSYPIAAGPLVHTPLFHELKIRDLC